MENQAKAKIIGVLAIAGIIAAFALASNLFFGGWSHVFEPDHDRPAQTQDAAADDDVPPNAGDVDNQVDDTVPEDEEAQDSTPEANADAEADGPPAGALIPSDQLDPVPDWFTWPLTAFHHSPVMPGSVIEYDQGLTAEAWEAAQRAVWALMYRAPGSGPGEAGREFFTSDARTDIPFAFDTDAWPQFEVTTSTATGPLHVNLVEAVDDTITFEIETPWQARTIEDAPLEGTAFWRIILQLQDMSWMGVDARIVSG